MSDPEPARRRRDLSVDEIVEQAIVIMRDEGEQALTMRRVATECGVTPMALYHHVDDKEDLLTLVVDDVVGASLPIEADEDPDADWRRTMVEFGCAYRRVFLDNPGAAAVFLRRPILSPNLARVTELLFRTLARGGVTGPAAAAAVDGIVLVTMGSIANDLTRPPEVRHHLTEQIPPGETPLMLEQIEPYAQRDGEARYRLALGWLLDGIERTAG